MIWSSLRSFDRLVHWDPPSAPLPWSVKRTRGLELNIEYIDRLVLRARRWETYLGLQRIEGETRE